MVSVDDDERGKEPENDGKNERKSRHKVADSWSKSWRAEIDACVPHDLRWTPAHMQSKKPNLVSNH